jgi:hypothetical protein
VKRPACRRVRPRCRSMRLACRRVRPRRRSMRRRFRFERPRSHSARPRRRSRWSDSGGRERAAASGWPLRLMRRLRASCVTRAPGSTSPPSTTRPSAPARCRSTSLSRVAALSGRFFPIRGLSFCRRDI